MHIFSWLARFRAGQRLAQIADRVAARSQTPVWRRVHVQACRMSHAEAYGYVRARAAKIVQREVNIAVAGSPPLGPAERATVVAAATQKVVRRTLADVTRAKKQHVSLQRAA